MIYWRREQEKFWLMSTPSKQTKNRTLLITRPAHQSSELSRLVEANGNSAYLFPTIEIRPVDDYSALLKKIDVLNKSDYAFFISPNAVTYAINAISDSIGPIPGSLILACVGAGSVAALNSAGYQCHLSPTEKFNSEALLELPELQNVKNKKIVIFRGNGGRNKLRDELKNRGAHVEYIECYQRSMPDTDIKSIVADLEQNNIDIISFTSADAARNIVAMLGKQAEYIFKLPVIVVSKRIADVCKTIGFTGNILQTESASNEAIVDILNNWHS